jgi:phospholipid/cholesterol/gamma-HCH transport system substrate-binding protein
VSDRKHIMVGLFVLGGLILLGVLIVWFKGVAGFVRGGYDITIHLDTSQGVSSGKPVTLDGLPVGSVASVYSSLPERPGVWTKVRITGGIRIPAETRFTAQQSTLGEILLDFKSPAQPGGEYLPMDGSVRLEGIAQSPSLLPQSVVDDLHDGITDLRKGVEQFRGLDTLIANLKELTEPRTLADYKAGKSKNLWTTLEQFENAAGTIQNEIQNPDSRFGKLLTEATKASQDLRVALDKAGQSLDEVNKAIASIEKAGKSVGLVSDNANVFLDKLSKDSDRLAAMLDNMNGVLSDVRQGKGTLGKLLTSDQLHAELVNLIENLQAMTDNANRLITMWRERGLLSKEGK